MASDVSADVAMAASAITSGDSGEDTVEKGDGKLSLRMKLVTPVEEGSSERFSLQSKSSHTFTLDSGSARVLEDGIYGDAGCTHRPLSNTFLSTEPTLSGEVGSGVKATTVAKAVTR